LSAAYLAASLGHEEVAEALQRLNVAFARLDGNDRNLEVDDGLRGQAGDGCGADVLQPNRQRTEGFLDATEFNFSLRGPLRVVFDHANRRVEAVVGRLRVARDRAGVPREPRVELRPRPKFFTRLLG
jgi:hypothetical protein